MKIPHIAAAGLVLILAVELCLKVNSYTSAEIDCSASFLVADNENALIGVSHKKFPLKGAEEAMEEKKFDIVLPQGKSKQVKLFLHNRSLNNIYAQLSEGTGVGGITVRQDTPVAVASGDSSVFEFDMHSDENLEGGTYEPTLFINAFWAGGSADIQYPITVKVTPDPAPKADIKTDAAEQAEPGLTPDPAAEIEAAPDTSGQAQANPSAQPAIEAEIVPDTTEQIQAGLTPDPDVTADITADLGERSDE